MKGYFYSSRMSWDDVSLFKTRKAMEMSSQTLFPEMQKLFIEKVQKAGRQTELSMERQTLDKSASQSYSL